MAKGQAERLMPMISELMRGAGIDWHDLTAIGVGIGPGNFTGIRISVAAARGLSLGLGIPAIGVTVFEALAHGQSGALAVVEDARRGAVYLQAFDGTGSAARLMSLDEAVPAAGVLPLTGSAAAVLAPITGAPILAPALPLVEAIARVAASRESSPQPRPAPFYLRSADAAPPSDPPPVILRG